MRATIFCGDNLYTLELKYIPRVGDQIIDIKVGKERICIIRQVIWRLRDNSVSIRADPDSYWDDSPEAKERKIKL